MKKIIIKIISFFASLIPIKILIKITGINVIYPFYHIISDNPPQHVKHLYSIKTTKQFRKDLDFLTKYFNSTIKINTELRSNKPSFFLSFDDGLQECFSIISPILKEYNIRAAFFINSGFVNNKDLFFRYKASIIIDKLLSKNILEEDKNKIEQILNTSKIINAIKKIKHKDSEVLDKIAKVLNINLENYLKEYKPYLTNSQIKELINDGHKIASHSINHPLFSDISDKDKYMQVAESMNFTKNTFNIDYKWFAFPFTDNNVSSSFFNKIYSENIIDYSFGTAGIKKDVISKNIQRIPLEKRNISAEKYIKTEYLLYFLKKLRGRNKIHR